MNPIEIKNTKDPLDILEEKYPVVFKNMTKDCYNEIPAGWFNLIDKLCGDITPIIEKEINSQSFNPEEYPFTILQIKEKFGGLRFYFQTNSENEDFHKSIRDLVDRAEDQSYGICSITGKPGKLCRKGSHYQTVCDELIIEQGFKVLGNGNS